MGRGKRGPRSAEAEERRAKKRQWISELSASFDAAVDGGASDSRGLRCRYPASTSKAA